MMMAADDGNTFLFRGDSFDVSTVKNAYGMQPSFLRCPEQLLINIGESSFIGFDYIVTFAVQLAAKHHVVDCVG
jgi:hypothetical protein